MCHRVHVYGGECACVKWRAYLHTLMPQESRNVLTVILGDLEGDRVCACVCA
jgi:hypothetical protein